MLRNDSTRASFIGSAFGVSCVFLFNAIYLHYIASKLKSKNKSKPKPMVKSTHMTSKINSPIRKPRAGSLSDITANIETNSASMTPILETIRTHQSNSPSTILVVGIAGGSGSGKTTLADAIFTGLGREENVTFISHDSYYKDLSGSTMAQREKTNFDHPNSLDTDLLVQHVKMLREGKDVNVPIYDFSTHSRTKNTTVVSPRKVVLVEGILIFTEPQLTELLDVKIFVDTESDLRLMRRISRDVQERGRSLDQVIEQYSRTVRPMHIEFVEPSKRKADIIVPVGINSVALSLITDHLKVALNDMGGEIKYVKTPYCESNAKERLLGSVVKETKRALLY